MANAPTEFSWNRVENKVGFSTTGTNTATPFAAPATLPTTGVQGAGARTLDYYVRFTLNDGTTIMVSGDDLFKLQSFSLGDNQTLNIGSQSSGTGAGKASFDPLHLTFSQLALDPELLKLLTTGAALKEVDVLGYTQATGGSGGQHLVENYSFGLVGVQQLATDDSGVTALDLQYGSQEIQYYQQNTTTGSFPSAPTSTQAWNIVTNTAIFSTNGTGSSTPAAAPLTLDTTKVAPSSGHTVDYYVRFTLADGTVVTVNGDQYFGLGQFSFDDQQTLNIGSQSSGAGAGKATFNPLQMTFGQQGLDPELLKLLASGTSLREVDVVGYANTGNDAAPHLVQEYSFGLVGVSGLATDNSGLTQLTLQYGSTDIKSYVQNADGSFPTTPNSESSWNRVENKVGFSTTGTNTATPFAAPATLPTTGVQGAGARTLDYYVRFTLNDGTTIMVSGDDLFKLQSFSLGDNQTLNIGSQSSGTGAGKASFDPLHLTFSQLALDPELLKLLTTGAALKEVDVLGYTQATGGSGGQHLVENYSFGLVGVQQLATDDSGVTALDLQYGSQEIQYYQQNTTTGSFPSAPTSTQAWNIVTNTAIFSTNGTGSSTPAAAPLTLDTTKVAPSSGHTVDYYVRFTLADGTVVTVNGDQYFGLGQFSFDDQQTLNIGSQSSGAGAGKATFNPLQMTFGQQGLDPELLKLLASGTSLREVDVVGYANTGNDAAPHLVQEYSFGLVGVSGLATDNSGLTQLTLQYGSTDIKSYVQNADGSFPTTPNSESSWNRVENKVGFSTTGTNTATPFAAPATLPTTGVQGAGARTLDYYVRFTLNDGTTIMVSGDDLFKLQSFSLGDNQTLNIGSQSSGTGAGKASFDPLHLTFSQLALDPELLKLLTTGAALKEVDVLGYTQATGGSGGQHLVENYSFGLVGVQQLATDDSGVTALDLQYGSQEIQYYQQNTTTGSFPSAPTSTQAWNIVTNTAIFSTNGTGSSTPAAAPLTLDTTKVAPSSGHTVDYYVRFTLADGTVVTVNGDQYFGLGQFSFDDQQTLNIGSQSSGAGAGKATFNPLQMTFGQQGLDPELLKLLASGTSLREVDVVGYANTGNDAAPHLVQEYSFGLVGVSGLATDNSGLTQLTLQYGSTDIHTFAVACYRRGTRILTRSGEVRVEDLKIGDDVATRTGAFRPIKWIGKRSYSGRFATGQKHILPICFKAGSLADNVPRRDLWISPHHAMYLEGVLIEARDLVNDVSIVQAEHVESVEYFHIELDTHDVIIAEGAPSETFVDDDSRGMFHNAHEYSLLYSEQRQHDVRYCAPRCDSGYEVEAARQCIEARAGLRSSENAGALALRGNVDRVTSDRIEGWAQNPDFPEIPVCLDIYLGDRLVGQTLANRYREDLKQAGLGSGCHSFTFMVASGDDVLSETIEVCRSLDGAKIASFAPAVRARRRYAVPTA